MNSMVTTNRKPQYSRKPEKKELNHTTTENYETTMGGGGNKEEMTKELKKSEK